MTERAPDQLREFGRACRLTLLAGTPYIRPTELDPELREAEVLIGFHAYFELANAAPRLRWHLTPERRRRPSAQRTHLRSTVLITTVPSLRDADRRVHVRLDPLLVLSLPTRHMTVSIDNDSTRGTNGEYRARAKRTTIAIVGYSTIGTDRMLARAFDMKVIATRRSVRRARRGRRRRTPADQPR